MLDGELDAAVVRRVMVHSDVCPSCSSFLDGIRQQARAHRQLAVCQMLDSMRESEVAEVAEVAGVGGKVLDRVGDPLAGEAGPDDAARELRRRLLENQRQLAKILYELGRGFVLMGVNPSFSRIVAREPVPVPDICLRGRNLLDEVDRLSTRQQMHVGQEWVRAKVLFSEREIRNPVENLSKGKRLLRETLMLWGDFHEARIYLGHAYQVEQKPDRAVHEFGRVLEHARNPVIRAFALENLGNLHLEQDRLSEAVGLFHQLVDSGVIDQEPRFYTTYFNMALTYGLMKKFDDCEQWLAVLDEQFPHRRRFIASEFSTRNHFAQVIRNQPEVQARFAERFPTWFSSNEGGEQ